MEVPWAIRTLPKIGQLVSSVLPAHSDHHQFPSTIFPTPTNPLRRINRMLKYGYTDVVSAGSSTKDWNCVTQPCKPSTHVSKGGGIGEYRKCWLLFLWCKIFARINWFPVCFFYAIATEIQLYHGSAMMYEMRGRNFEPTHWFKGSLTSHTI